MLRTLCYRVCITLLNIFFPPFAVGLLDGFSTDCLVNSILFVCGVLPSHVHGFYISCAYFSRRGKVRKGRYPGGGKAFIYTDRILNGGATNTEVRRLYEKQMTGEKAGRGRRSPRPRSPRPRSPVDGQGTGSTGYTRDGYENAQRSSRSMSNGYTRPPVSRAGSRRNDAEVPVSPLAPTRSWR